VLFFQVVPNIHHSLRGFADYVNIEDHASAEPVIDLAAAVLPSYGPPQRPSAWNDDEDDRTPWDEHQAPQNESTELAARGGKPLSMAGYRHLLQRSGTSGSSFRDKDSYGSSFNIYNGVYSNYNNNNNYDYSLQNLSNNVMFIDEEAVQEDNVNVLGNVNELTVKTSSGSGHGASTDTGNTKTQARAFGLGKVLSTVALPAPTVSELAGADGRRCESGKVPQEVRGYLRTEGVMVKSWKTKYFLLREGVLYCFGSEAECVKMSDGGFEPLRLACYRVMNSNKRIMRLFSVAEAKTGEQREVVLDASNAHDLLMWLQGFSDHISYADSVNIRDESSVAIGADQPAQVSANDVNREALVEATAEPAAPVAAPDTMQGYLRIEGTMLKSWKKKYFVLKDGVLHTFGSDAEAESVLSWASAGAGGFDPVRLGHYVLSNPSKRMLKLTPHVGTDLAAAAEISSLRSVLLDALDNKSFGSWQSMLESHIRYAALTSSASN
jgi:hypothetical protein